MICVSVFNFVFVLWDLRFCFVLIGHRMIQWTCHFAIYACSLALWLALSIFATQSWWAPTRMKQLSTDAILLYRRFVGSCHCYQPWINLAESLPFRQSAALRAASRNHHAILPDLDLVSGGDSHEPIFCSSAHKFCSAFSFIIPCQPLVTDQLSHGLHFWTNHRDWRA